MIDLPSFSTLLDIEEREAAGRCPRCRGRGFILYERDNPAAAEPCGCDEDQADEDEAEDRIAGSP